MAMRIAPVPHFWAEVKFSMIGDLDQSIEVAFKVKYKRLEASEYEDLMRRVQAARLAAITPPPPSPPGSESAADSAQRTFTDQQVIDEVVLDWDDVLGDDDQKLPFTRDNLERALKALGCKAAIVKRFFDLHSKELEKNFARPPATTSGT